MKKCINRRFSAVLETQEPQPGSPASSLLSDDSSSSDVEIVGLSSAHQFSACTGPKLKVEQPSDSQESVCQLTSDSDEPPVKRIKENSDVRDTVISVDECTCSNLWLKNCTRTIDNSDVVICNVCNVIFCPTKHGIFEHINLECHMRDYLRLSEIANSVTAPEDDVKWVLNAVKRAELKLTAFLATNDIPLELMTTLESICENIFPDSQIAKNIQLDALKAKTILKEVLGKSFADETAELIRNHGNFFTILMDETIDRSGKKQCTLTAITYNNSSKEITTRFLDTICTTSETFVMCLLEMIDAKGIPRNNLVGITSSMNELLANNDVEQAIPHIAIVTSSCHTVNLSASKACLNLPRYVEDLLRNIGSHLSRNPNEPALNQELVDFFKFDVHDLLTYSQTRWLSLKACVDKVLENYEPLKSYFKSNLRTAKSRTAEDMVKSFDTKFTIIFLELMSYILELLTTFKKKFQTETPLLYKLKPEVEKLLQLICSNYMKMSYLRSMSIFSLNFKDSRHFLPLRDICIGVKASKSMRILTRDPKVLTKDVDAFYETCFSFYVELATDIAKRFNFNDSLYDIITILDPSEAQSFKEVSLGKVFKRFPILNEHVKLQDADIEWREHALLDFHKLGLDISLPVDKYWGRVFHLKDSSGNPLFYNLEKVIGLLLILPFSNNSVERVFKTVRRIGQCQRGETDSDITVAFMNTKQGIESAGNLLYFEPSNDMISSKIWDSIQSE